MKDPRKRKAKKKDGQAEAGGAPATSSAVPMDTSEAPQAPMVWRPGQDPIEVRLLTAVC